MRHTVTLHHVITVYNDRFDHMDGVMQAVAKKKTSWKKDLFFSAKLARQKLSKYHVEVTPSMGMLLSSAHILDPFWKFQSFRKWDKGLDIHPEDKTFYTTQYQEAFLKYVENEYSAKNRRVRVNKLENLPSSNIVRSATASGSCKSCFDRDDSYSNDEQFVIPNHEAETTPGRSDCAARLLTTARLHLNSLPEVPKN